MATPMLSLLRKAKPDAEIHVLTMFVATRELFLSNPNLDAVHYYDFIHSNIVESLLYLIHLRNQGFDRSINIYPQNRREYNLFALLIGAGERLGIKYGHRGWLNFDWLLSRTVREDHSLHCVEENISILRLLGISPDLNESTLPPLELHLLSSHTSFADTWLELHNLNQSNDKLIGIHAGTALFKNHIRRRWAPEKFAELAKRLHATTGNKILLFGGPDDIEANRTIVQLASDSVLSVNTTSIMDSIAVMQRLSLFISNDSALMHIAGALQLPTVAIFGPTNETYVHPWKTTYEIVHTGIECRPCFYYSPKPLTCYRSESEQFICINDIEVEQVYGRVKGILNLT